MPFSPSDISGLKIWLKADAGAGSSDGDPVGTWTDQSGTSHDFTQATAGKKPLYKTNVRNGLPVIRFDAADDELTGGDLSAVFPSAASVFCAVNDKSNTSNGKLMVYQTKANDLHWHFTSGEGYEGVFRSTRLNNTPASGLPLSGWHLWSFTANGTAYKMWLDSVNKINAGSFTFDGGNNHGIGHQASDGYYTFMDLGELIVYDTALSDVDRVSVEDYLFAKWAISSPNGTGTPATVAGSGTVPAPTVTGVAFATPSVVAGVGTVPAANAFGQTDTGQPATVAGVGSVPAPSGQGSSTTTPAVVAGVGTVPASTGFGIGVANPSAVAVVGTVPAPTAIGAFNAVATPATVRGVGHVYPPHFPSTVAPGGGTGGSGGGGTSEVSVLWVMYRTDIDG